MTALLRLDKEQGVRSSDDRARRHGLDPRWYVSMGSDRHYPGGSARPRAAVDGFWIDRTPVTNGNSSNSCKQRVHVTTAEVPPDPKDYPGALPHMLYAGSLVFIRPR
jgi:hypothetical protein